jgi:hypothetical protein
MGEYMKFEMVMEVVDVASPAPPADPDVDVEPDAAPDGEDDPPPLPQAARSSADPRTRTIAPPLYRRTGSRTVRPPVMSG